MAIQKYTGFFKKPLNFQTNSPQADAWRAATLDENPEYFGVVKYVYNECTGCVYRNMEKHQTGVINTRIEGGKWEKVRMRQHPITGELESFEEMKERLNLRPGNFRGGPRI